MPICHSEFQIFGLTGHRTMSQPEQRQASPSMNQVVSEFLLLTVVKEQVEGGEKKEQNHKARSFTVLLFLADLQTGNIPNEQLTLPNGFSSKRPIMVRKSCENALLARTKIT